MTFLKIFFKSFKALNWIFYLCDPIALNFPEYISNSMSSFQINLPFIHLILEQKRIKEIVSRWKRIIFTLDWSGVEFSNQKLANKQFLLYKQLTRHILHFFKTTLAVSLARSVCNLFIYDLINMKRLIKRLVRDKWLFKQPLGQMCFKRHKMGIKLNILSILFHPSQFVYN